MTGPHRTTISGLLSIRLSYSQRLADEIATMGTLLSKSFTRAAKACFYRISTISIFALSGSFGSENVLDLLCSSHPHRFPRKPRNFSDDVSLSEHNELTGILPSRSQREYLGQQKYQNSPTVQTTLSTAVASPSRFRNADIGLDQLQCCLCYPRRFRDTIRTRLVSCERTILSL